MTKEVMKARHELLNESLWLLLKKYIKDNESYKKVIMDLFKMYVGYDNSDKKFSDEWWEEVINKFQDYPEKYKKTELEDFACDLAICFCGVWEREKKVEVNNVDFYRVMCKAFINEWGRLRDGEENQKKAT